jgi:membrane-associated phospholipid phosphatase
MGTSFPSGHTTAAAATYLAVALVLGIGSSPKARAAVAGGAVAIGVAVGATRVLLGVHWFSDALAGLAIGWSWFGICAVAFGGRLLPSEHRRRSRSLHPPTRRVLNGALPQEAILVATRKALRREHVADMVRMVA